MTVELDLEELVERTRGRIKKLVYHYRIPPEDAEDLLQEVFLCLVRRWPELRSVVRDPEGWLLGVTNWMCRAYFRARQQSWLCYAEDEEPERRSPPLAPPQLRVEEERDLDRLLAGLNPRERERLWLWWALDLPPGEVAARTGCRPESVRKLAGRTLRRLQASV